MKILKNYNRKNRIIKKLRSRLYNQYIEIEKLTTKNNELSDYEYHQFKIIRDKSSKIGTLESLLNNQERDLEKALEYKAKYYSLVKMLKI